MIEQTSPTTRLHDEFIEKQTLFNAQPAIVQRFLEAQSRLIADALIEHHPYVKFTLPDKIVAEISQSVTVPVLKADHE